MKISEAISEIDELRQGNTYSRGQKIAWLSSLDSRIFKEIISTHQVREPRDFTGYTPETPEDTVLLAPAPYDEMYLDFLASKIDHSNADFEMENVSAAAFMDYYSDFADDYNRTHMPLHTKIKYF